MPVQARETRGKVVVMRHGTTIYSYGTNGVQTDADAIALRERAQRARELERAFLGRHIQTIEDFLQADGHKIIVRSALYGLAEKGNKAALDILNGARGIIDIEDLYQETALCVWNLSRVFSDIMVDENLNMHGGTFTGTAEKWLNLSDAEIRKAVYGSVSSALYSFKTRTAKHEPASVYRQGENGYFEIERGKYRDTYKIEVTPDKIKPLLDFCGKYYKGAQSIREYIRLVASGANNDDIESEMKITAENRRRLSRAFMRLGTLYLQTLPTDTEKKTETAQRERTIYDLSETEKQNLYTAALMETAKPTRNVISWHVLRGEKLAELNRATWTGENYTAAGNNQFSWEYHLLQGLNESGTDRRDRKRFFESAFESADPYTARELSKVWDAHEKRRKDLERVFNHLEEDNFKAFCDMFKSADTYTLTELHRLWDTHKEREKDLEKVFNA